MRLNKRTHSHTHACKVKNNRRKIKRDERVLEEWVAHMLCIRIEYFEWEIKSMENQSQRCIFRAPVSWSAAVNAYEFKASESDRQRHRQREKLATATITKSTEKKKTRTFFLKVIVVIKIVVNIYRCVWRILRVYKCIYMDRFGFLYIFFFLFISLFQSVGRLYTYVTCTCFYSLRNMWNSSKYVFHQR